MCRWWARTVAGARNGPEVSELLLRFSAAEPVEFHVHGLGFRGMMVLLVTTTDVELSHWMGVLGFGHPISMIAWRSGMIYSAMVKRPSSSASDAYDRTFLMICAIVRTGPL